MVGCFNWEELPTMHGGYCMGPTFLRRFPSGQVVLYGMDTLLQKMRIGIHAPAPTFVDPCMLKDCAREE